MSPRLYYRYFKRNGVVNKKIHLFRSSTATVEECAELCFKRGAISVESYLLMPGQERAACTFFQYGLESGSCFGFNCGAFDMGCDAENRDGLCTKFEENENHVIYKMKTYDDMPASEAPTEKPTAVPTSPPTPLPTQDPTPKPTEPPSPSPSLAPTLSPTPPPTLAPTPTPSPTPSPTPKPKPTPEPTPEATAVPTATPTQLPTEKPSVAPSQGPSAEPTPMPTLEDTAVPTPAPTQSPTPKPTADPTAEPTPEITSEPTAEPTPVPTPEPSLEPTPEPTPLLTPLPTIEPTPFPTDVITDYPTGEPTAPPTEVTEEPTPPPTLPPTPRPSPAPTKRPSEAPSAEPTKSPAPLPTRAPTHPLVNGQHTALVFTVNFAKHFTGDDLVKAAVRTAVASANNISSKEMGEVRLRCVTSCAAIEPDASEGAAPAGVDVINNKTKLANSAAAPSDVAETKSPVAGATSGEETAASGASSSRVQGARAANEVAANKAQPAEVSDSGNMTTPADAQAASAPSQQDAKAEDNISDAREMTPEDAQAASETPANGTTPAKAGEMTPADDSGEDGETKPSEIEATTAQTGAPTLEAESAEATTAPKPPANAIDGEMEERAKPMNMPTPKAPTANDTRMVGSEDELELDSMEFVGARLGKQRALRTRGEDVTSFLGMSGSLHEVGRPNSTNGTVIVSYDLPESVKEDAMRRLPKKEASILLSKIITNLKGVDPYSPRMEGTASSDEVAFRMAEAADRLKRIESQNTVASEASKEIDS